MTGDVKGAGRSEVGDSAAPGSLHAVAVELATGLSVADIEALRSDSSPKGRAAIAVKFAREFDRLAESQANELTMGLLTVISKDRNSEVRMHFARSIRESPNLPAKIAKRFARDDIEIAGDVLRDSPVLDDTFLGEIVTSMPEAYALAIADRHSLSEELVDRLIEHKGTKRVVARLLDNDEARFSEAALLRLNHWGRIDQDIADRLRRRPNLPFAFVNQGVADLADRVAWRSLGERTMTKVEATQLQDLFEGKAGLRRSTRGEWFDRLYGSLMEAFEKGELTPSSLLAYLRDGDIDRLECGFSAMADLDLKWVRKLLYGSDRRGLIALCLKAAFTTADYLAFRMALSLAELGRDREQSQQHYSERNMKFASDQYERMRADPHELRRWLPRNPA